MAIAIGVAPSDYTEYHGTIVQDEDEKLAPTIQEIVDRIARMFATIEDFREYVELAADHGGAPKIDQFFEGGFIGGAVRNITGKSVRSDFTGKNSELDLVDSYWVVMEFPMSKDKIADLREYSESDDCDMTFDELLAEESDELVIDVWDKDLRFALTRFVIGEETPRFHESFVA